MAYKRIRWLGKVGCDAMSLKADDSAGRRNTGAVSNKWGSLASRIYVCHIKTIQLIVNRGNIGALF